MAKPDKHVLQQLDYIDHELSQLNYGNEVDNLVRLFRNLVATLSVDMDTVSDEVQPTLPRADRPMTYLGHPEYIGDGVYASFDGYQVWVRLSPETSGREVEIALNPDVMEALVSYNLRMQTDRLATIIRQQQNEEKGATDEQGTTDQAS